MKKANTIQAAPVSISDTDTEALASYLSLCGNAEHMQLANEMRSTEDSRTALIDRIDEYQRDLEDVENEIDHLQERIDGLPPAPVVSPEEARKDMEAAAALSFVKSIRREDGYLIIQTRENALYTTLTKKFSRSARWYKVKPYQIPLPAYNIKLSLVPARTLANNYALTINLANLEDMAHFSDIAAQRYGDASYHHWGTRQGYRGENSYQQLCLGEYEGEVSSAFRKSVKEGLIALSIYLQVSGTRNSYVSSGRELWALWLGKEEYNRLMIPSEKTEAKELAGAIPEAIEDCACYEDDERQCSDECECDCHND